MHLLHHLAAMCFHRDFADRLNEASYTSSIEDVPLEAILHALADPARVALFYEIVYQEGPKTAQSW